MDQQQMLAQQQLLQQQQQQQQGEQANGDKDKGVQFSPASSTYLVCGTRFTVDPRYELVEPVGAGAYGVVCSAKDLKTGNLVAIKKVTKAFSNLTELRRTLREILLLRQFNHSNVLEIHDIMKPECYEKFDDVYIVSTLMSTDLNQIIFSDQALSEQHIQYFVYQILRGLKYVHSTNTLHRDLKPSNLLCNANCDLKICDFGLSRVMDEGEEQTFMTEYVATRWYRAPEIMLACMGTYTKAIDVWSVGCILAELLGRKHLLPGRDQMNQLNLILEILGTPSEEDLDFIANAQAKNYVRNLPLKIKKPFSELFPDASPAVIDLLDKMLAFSPDRRITVDEALKHPYFQLLHDPLDEPVADTEASFPFDVESSDHNVVTLKKHLWEIVCSYHPELTHSPGSPTRFSGPGLSNTQNEQQSNFGHTSSSSSMSDG